MALGNEWKRYIRLAEERPEDFVQSDRLEIVWDEETVERFEKDSGRKIGVIYESDYHILVVDLVREGERIFAYERLLLKQSGAIVAIPRYKGKFILLRQYRHALRSEQYAFPRGFGEPGVSALENVKKEISEELGTQREAVHNIIHLGQVVADSGVCGGCADVFACDVEEWDVPVNYEGILSALLLSEKEFTEYIEAGKINDGYTLSAFCLYKNIH